MFKTLLEETWVHGSVLDLSNGKNSNECGMGRLALRLFEAIFVLTLNGSKYSLKYIYNAVHVFGILDLHTTRPELARLEPPPWCKCRCEGSPPSHHVTICREQLLSTEKAKTTQQRAKAIPGTFFDRCLCFNAMLCFATGHVRIQP